MEFQSGIKIAAQGVIQSVIYSYTGSQCVK